MRRILSLVLAAGLIPSWAFTASAHVHQYLEHDHPEHHHGIATHDHPGAEPAHAIHHGEVDAQPNLEALPCDAGRHAVRIRAACLNIPDVPLSVAEVPGPAFGLPAVTVGALSAITDIRVHGPPFLGSRSARAPPTSLPA